MGDDGLQPGTERVGGGMAARLAAVGAVGLLVGVIWFGATGRTSVPDSPDLVAAATPAPATSPSAPPASRAPGPAPTTSKAAHQPPGSRPVPPARRYGRPEQDAFAVVFRLNGRHFLDVLRPEAPGLLTAVVRVPLYGELPTTPMQILQLWTREDRPALATVASYRLMLGELLADSPAAVLLDAHADPHPRRRSAPRLVRLGYRLIVTTDIRTDHALLHFRMAVGDGDEQARPSGVPLILLAGQAGQAGTPRGKALTGYGWVAGY